MRQEVPENSHISDIFQVYLCRKMISHKWFVRAFIGGRKQLGLTAHGFSYVKETALVCPY
jgi:hypothetical protein